MVDVVNARVDLLEQRVDDTKKEIVVRIDTAQTDIKAHIDQALSFGENVSGKAAKELRALRTIRNSNMNTLIRKKDTEEKEAKRKHDAAGGQSC
jgi:hypothetical protein